MKDVEDSKSTKTQMDDIEAETYICKHFDCKNNFHQKETYSMGLEVVRK